MTMPPLFITILAGVGWRLALASPTAAEAAAKPARKASPPEPARAR